MFVECLSCKNRHKELKFTPEKLGGRSKAEIRIRLAWLQSPTFNHHVMLYLKIAILIYSKLTLGPGIILSPVYLLSQLSPTIGLSCKHLYFSSFPDDGIEAQKN